jgi:hypothetical protein
MELSFDGESVPILWVSLVRLFGEQVRNLYGVDLLLLSLHAYFLCWISSWLDWISLLSDILC